MSILDNLLAMLEKGQDNALLRYGIGSEYLKADQFDDAVSHLAVAVEHDPGYSAAWKLYAKALAGAGQTDTAASAYRQGIEVATAKGDIQSAREMQVFLKRLLRDTG